MFPKTKDKGFTLVELILVILIIGVIAVLAANLVNGAEIKKFMPVKNSSAAWKGALVQLKEDPSLSLIVLAYADTWDVDKVDYAIESVRDVMASFERAGIVRNRLILGIANQGALTYEEQSSIDGDGIYLQLTY
ncbi:MAG: hypothetical protein AMJ56_07685 [Anaerolineae bacterium SG8_19]|nr:MAG: hypothetical protein AMJ56_07685 [Anaerolineae bacterium SG8_19]